MFLTFVHESAPFVFVKSKDPNSFSRDIVCFQENKYKEKFGTEYVGIECREDRKMPEEDIFKYIYSGKPFKIVLKEFTMGISQFKNLYMKYCNLKPLSIIFESCEIDSIDRAELEKFNNSLHAPIPKIKYSKTYKYYTLKLNITVFPPIAPTHSFQTKSGIAKSSSSGKVDSFLAMHRRPNKTVTPDNSMMNELGINEGFMIPKAVTEGKVKKSKSRETLQKLFGKIVK